jgi:hypothetical protein
LIAAAPCVDVPLEPAAALRLTPQCPELTFAGVAAALLDAATRRALDEEAERLVAFHA